MWMRKEIREDRIKDLKECVGKGTAAMAFGLFFSVLGIVVSQTLASFFWVEYLCLGSFGATLVMGHQANKMNRKHRKWLMENENLITVLDSVDPTFVHQDGEAGFFCIDLDPCEPVEHGPDKLTEAVRRFGSITSAWLAKYKGTK